MKPLAQMNVIPFIDVMLVLLAVVLTTATFVAQGKIPVALPGATQADALPEQRKLELTIDASGQLYLGEQSMSLEQLDERLTEATPDLHLLLRVDESTAFRHFVAVVDLLTARDMQNLSIVAKQLPQR